MRPDRPAKWTQPVRKQKRVRGRRRLRGYPCRICIWGLDRRLISFNASDEVDAASLTLIAGSSMPVRVRAFSFDQISTTLDENARQHQRTHVAKDIKLWFLCQNIESYAVMQCSCFWCMTFSRRTVLPL